MVVRVLYISLILKGFVKMRTILKRYALTVVGAAIMAISLDLFLVPADIAPGGVSGLAVVINHLTEFPVGLAILALNIPVFILGAKNFSKGFVVVSLFGMISLSLITDAFSFLVPVTRDILLSSVYGGVLMGCGIGIVFRENASTGGTEIVAHVLRKKFPNFSVGRFVLLIDAVIVLLAGIVYHKWEVVLYSAVTLYISSYIIDLIVEGGDFAKVAYVVSDKPKEISDEISMKLEHGTTALKASSMYTGNDKTVLMCVVKKYEIGKLKEIIQATDSNAFVIVSDTREVLGNGFKR